MVANSRSQAVRPLRRSALRTVSSFLGPVVGVLPGASCWGSAPAGTRSLLTTTDGAPIGEQGR